MTKLERFEQLQNDAYAEIRSFTTPAVDVRLNVVITQESGPIGTELVVQKGPRMDARALFRFLKKWLEEE